MGVSAFRSGGDVSSMFDGADPVSLSDEVLKGRVLGYAAQITALTADFLELVAELDGRESWRGPGIHSLAHWLSWKAGIAPRTAHEQVRVAKATGAEILIHSGEGVETAHLDDGPSLSDTEVLYAVGEWKESRSTRVDLAMSAA